MKIACKGEQIGCFVNDTLVHETILPAIPSLVSTAALDKEAHTIILKVINTTQHEEKTELNLQGVSVKNTAEIIQLTGDPEARNTYDHPGVVVPGDKRNILLVERSQSVQFPSQLDYDNEIEDRLTGRLASDSKPMPVARPTDADPLTAGCLPDEIKRLPQ